MKLKPSRYSHPLIKVIQKLTGHDGTFNLEPQIFPVRQNQELLKIVSIDYLTSTIQ